MHMWDIYVGRHLSRTLKKYLHSPAEDRTGVPSSYSLALYHVAIKAGLYRKAVQVYYIPNLYPEIYARAGRAIAYLHYDSNSIQQKQPAL